MRITMLMLALTVATVMPARAEDSVLLPEVVVGAPATKPKQAAAPTQAAPASRGNGPGRERCVDVKIGDDHSLGCLNQQLKRKVDEVNPTVNTPPLDARSPDTKTGIINIPGVQQQYGKNFGNSVIPYRPGR